MILVTGAAGFIGYSLTKRLLRDSVNVVGLDCLSDYYSVELKKRRLAELNQNARFDYIEENLLNIEFIEDLLKHRQFDCVVHLAAQPGVRYSLINPLAYIDNNIKAFTILVEAIRKHSKQSKFIYASSSSVYGSNSKLPYSEDDDVSSPSSLYAMTKRSNELHAKTYKHLYGLNSIGLRFFTVYGPYGRPDMAPYLFTDALFHNRQFPVFAEGKLMRDFTFIDDIVDGIISAIKYENNDAEIFNLGNNNPVTVNEFVTCLEDVSGYKANYKFEPMQKGDVIATYADISKSQKFLKFTPKTPLKDGLTEFVNWYSAYIRSI
jgi:UDP-glucuronate 4-epimerase